jgi:2'-5' RNA ligase
MMTDQIRTFVACEIPREIRSDIGQIQESLKRRRLRLKWVRPDNLHLTLRFLGEVPAERLETIAAAIGKAAQYVEPLSLTAKGIGVFPGIRRARIIWVGIGGQHRQLLALQAAVADALAGVGFSQEKRPYKGHLTIGRVKSAIDPRQLAEALTEFSGFETASFVVDAVVVFRSQLRPDGPVYTRLRTVKLEAH